jgi:hypothetical protein
MWVGKCIVDYQSLKPLESVVIVVNMLCTLLSDTYCANIRLLW